MTQLLVIDDDEDFAGAVRMVLQSRGFDVAMEYDPLQALQRIEQKQPDVVILDVMFPEDPVAGVKLARTLRQKFPELPILMLTAVSQQMPLAFSSRDIDPALLPVTEFIEKPIDFTLLCDKLDRLLNRPTIATEEHS